MFGLQDDNGNPPQNLALRAPQLAFLLMWVSGFLNTMNVSCSTSPDLQVAIARHATFLTPSLAGLRRGSTYGERIVSAVRAELWAAMSWLDAALSWCYVISLHLWARSWVSHI